MTAALPGCSCGPRQNVRWRLPAGRLWPRHATVPAARDRACRPPIEERGAGLSAFTMLAGVVYCGSSLLTDDHAPEWMLPVRTANHAALW